MALNGILDQIDLIDSFNTFYTKAAEYLFPASIHETFSRIDHMFGNKTSFNKFKNFENIPKIFSDCNSKKLEVN